MKKPDKKKTAPKDETHSYKRLRREEENKMDSEWFKDELNELSNAGRRIDHQE